MKVNNQIKFGAVLSYVSIGFNILAGLLYTPWMIQQIGKNDYGIYTLANSIITLFLMDFGLSSATSRYISKYVAEGRQDKADSFLGTIYKLYIGLDIIFLVVFTAFFFFIDSIYVNLLPSELEKFKVVFLIAAGYALLNFPFVTLNGILTAYEKFVQLKFATLLQHLLMVGLMVIALFNGAGLYTLVIVNAVSGILTIIYKLSVIKKKTVIKVDFSKSEKNIYKEIFGFSIWITISVLAQRLIFNITPSILGIVAGSSDIAVFGIITTIEQYSYMITTAINGMFLPKISRIYSGESAEKNIMPLIIKVGKFQCAINVLIVVGFAALGKDFLLLWMGKDFALAYYGILLVMIPGVFFNALEIANTAMIVQKKVHIQAKIAIAVGVVNIVCSFIFSYLWGVIGSTISIFLAYSLRDILYMIAYQKVMKFDMIMFIKQCFIKMLPATVVTLLIGVALNKFMDKCNWLFLGLKGSIIAIVFLVAAVFTIVPLESIKNALKKVKGDLYTD